MKRTLTSLLLSLILIFGVCTLAQADFYAEVYNTGSLNVRTGPAASYQWLGEIHKGEQVRVTGQSGNWYLITTLDGKLTGYASKNFLKTVTNNATQLGAYAVVYNTDSLNLRSGPGAEYQWLGSLEEGGWVKVTGQTGNWYQVTFNKADGGTLSGYMSKNYLKTSESGTSSNIATVQNPAGTSFLNLREYPSYAANVLGIFYNGTQCTVLNKQTDGWWRVSVNQNGDTLYGYFRSEYLSQGGASSVRVNTSSGTGGSLNLRDNPSYNAGVLRQIPNGATVSVKLRGDEFWLVEYDGTQGFAAAKYLGGASSGSAGTTNGNAVVKTGNTGKLNLRAQANPNAKILGRYANGTSVHIIERGTAWCYVSVNGETGYMMTKYLSISGSTATKRVDNTNGGSYVNLRSAPEKETGNVNIRVPDGAQVNLLSWGEVWSQVSYNGVTGYMMSWFLK